MVAIAVHKARPLDEVKDRGLTSCSAEKNYSLGSQFSGEQGVM